MEARDLGSGIGATPTVPNNATTAFRDFAFVPATCNEVVSPLVV